MEDARIEFTNATNVRAEALGKPGKRTFRITVDSGSSSAMIWLEKEQLFQLALGVQQLLATQHEGENPPESPPVEREAPEMTRLDFKVGKIALGHDGQRGMFIVDAHSEEENEDSAATVRVWLSREQARSLSEEAMRACASGRPLCPLCGGPIDTTGHQCPRVNGHADSLEL